MPPLRGLPIQCQSQPRAHPLGYRCFAPAGASSVLKSRRLPGLTPRAESLRPCWHARAQWTPQITDARDQLP